VARQVSRLERSLRMLDLSTDASLLKADLLDGQGVVVVELQQLVSLPFKASDPSHLDG
jgi:hypothetical protein